MDATLIVHLIEVLLGGGLAVGLKNLWDFFVKKNEQSTPQFKIATQIELTEKALLSVSSAKEAVEKDNARIREMRDAERAQHEQREKWWQAQEASWHDKLVEYEQEIDRLREQLGSVMCELDRLKRNARQDREGLESHD